MRKINYIVLHCTATQPDATISSIQNYWRSVMLWRNPGYHLIIKADGDYDRLAEDKDVTNGVAGHNANSIHISYVGGVDTKNKPKDTRTDKQKTTLLTLVRTMRSRYPGAKIVGHRDFPGVKKACPSFDVAKWLEEVGIDQDLK
jgi:N-acetylmuramoyl-L-alanine amidase